MNINGIRYDLLREEGCKIRKATVKESLDKSIPIHIYKNRSVVVESINGTLLDDSEVKFLSDV